MGIFSLGLLYAQIGINTKTPQGVFHMDPEGNTSGTANIKDDIIIASDGASGVNIALGGKPVIGASIALHSTNKGFVPNVVQLTSAIDVTTIPNPVIGMVVYNSSASGLYPDNTIPGCYMYNGIRWMRLQTNAYLGVSETRVLETPVTSSSSSTTAVTVAPLLDFGSITIFEDGVYAFSFNVAGTSSTGSLIDKITVGILYLYVLKKSVGESSFSLYQTIEVNPFLFPNGRAFTITSIAGMELKSKDELQIRTLHNNSYPSISYSKNTYMVYWKL